ncbi:MULTISPECIES: hypothetical protein [Stenotrophomonas]|uniref:hypothetical protein n=1 Tax=Stenotrophomonas TaxID=40323 RepID=UPI000AAAF41B|nr:MULTISPECIES: hypothetical protein [Stenotrophomonas]MBN4984626.1 hypothetical protein [Stenotrophomonas maltophilia]MDQ7300591.1 hypothetical protein [Stenotrophomonas sp. Sm2017]MRE89946.1 hypothetical protein [Stenotrophomonas sp. M37]MRF20517.1 hypothetical protein [Stenotrophomonas sp. MY18]MRF52587.1 hypothetical protein [Stenotrophomonas sp. MY15]
MKLINNHLSACACAFAIAIISSSCSPTDRSTDSSQQASNTPQQSESSEHTLKESGRSTAVDAPPTEGTPNLEYRCSGAACELEALSAKNPEEAEWLRKNGYPSEEQLKQFKAASDAQLKRQADAGSLPAMVVYGERMTAAGDTKTGIAYIHGSINRGSVYGYYGMSEVYQKTPGLKNIVDSAAYLRVAYLLGDSKASVEMQRRFPDLTPVEQVAIDQRAMTLYRSFASGAQPDPRP